MEQNTVTLPRARLEQLKEYASQLREIADALEEELGVYTEIDFPEVGSVTLSGLPELPKASEAPKVEIVQPEPVQTPYEKGKRYDLDADVIAVRETYRGGYRSLLLKLKPSLRTAFVMATGKLADAKERDSVQFSAVFNSEGRIHLFFSEVE